MADNDTRAVSSQIRLVVRVGATQQSYSFQAPRQQGIFIGRDSVYANVPIDSRLVSRLHAAILLRGAGEWTLTDLGARNGTFLNGHRVGHEALHDDDEITVGDCSIRVLLQ